MSGHSKWATIHRAKGVKDAARGKLFSKIARLITIAVKTGGGPNPDSNFKLRDAIEKARIANMPKDNIDRAISKGTGGGEALEEVSYEGFGPAGIAVIIEAATDNRNRTGQEIKNMLEKSGGRLGGPGAVSFQFAPSGYILVEKATDVDSQTLQLIDAGVDDIEEIDDGIECFVAPSETYHIRKAIEEMGFKVKSAELIMRPHNMVKVENPAEAAKVLSFLEQVNDHDDVQKVFTNADFPESMVAIS